MEVNVVQVGNATVAFLTCAVMNLAMLRYVLKRNQVTRNAFPTKSVSPSKKIVVISKER